MRTRSNSRGLLTAVAILGLAALAPFSGCGGDGGSIAGSTATGTGGSGGTGGAGGSGAGPECGNGIKEDVEACDDGNQVVGDGCENDCSFTCTAETAATKCDDKDPCNGVETCGDDNVCAPDKLAEDGTDCGNGNICIKGVCTGDVCGDGFKSKSEECDDGNVVNGDGCDACTFSCVSTDPARNCSNLDPCVATTCDDATHQCGTPLAPGAECGMPGSGMVCKNGLCSPPLCGDTLLDVGEQCDDGNLTDGDGCDKDCTYSCANPAMDCPPPSACQKPACASNICTEVPDPTKNGNACGTNLECQDGACIAPTAVCGNGKIEMGEDCDFGAENGTGKGCSATCKFSCAVDADCADAETCNGTETCVTTTVNGQMGKLCQAGMAANDCSACAGGVCSAGACKASTCGDMCVNMGAGEECDPPAAGTCNAQCKKIVSVCGNGVRVPGEQCDDNNLVNLDGCDSACKFEQCHRINYLKMQFGTDSYCTQNQLGSAISGLAQGTLQGSIDAGVTDGSISVVMKLLGLDDLSGTSDPAVDLGVMNASPIIPMGSMYLGSSDLDWWHSIEALSIDASRTPIAKLAGSITAKNLTAGPGTIIVTLNLAGSPAPLKLSSTKLAVSIGTATIPTASTNGNTPGHVAGENLDPTLASFDSAGQQTTTGSGKLCGNVSAASLAKVPAPADLVQGGANACIENYTSDNSMLDVLIGGCKVFGGFVTLINIRQPDQVDPGVPAAGAGGPYKLQRNNTTKAVNACTDKNNTSVDLKTCLDAAAYSSFFRFATNRVIAKP